MRLFFSQPQRDPGIGDYFYISASEVLTKATIAPLGPGVLPLRRSVVSNRPSQKDSPIMARLIRVLLGDTEITHVRMITVIDEHHIRVSGSWLITGLLKHWIELEFRNDGAVMIVDDPSFRPPEVVAV